MKKTCEKFDLIISNPPFEFGNQIIHTAVGVAKKCVVLMPASKYRDRNLYQHVTDAFTVDPTAFKDAIITPNLCVARLTPTLHPGTYDDFYVSLLDKKYADFFRLNNLLPRVESIALSGRSDRSSVDHLNLADYFLFTRRYATDKVPADLERSQCVMKRYNYEKNYDAIFNNNDNGKPTTGFLVYIGQKACENLTTFVFKNPLMNEILDACKDNVAPPSRYLPRIDWSVDRDYEHLTLNQLLEIMREELKNPHKPYGNKATLF